MAPHRSSATAWPPRAPGASGFDPSASPLTAAGHRRGRRPASGARESGPWPASAPDQSPERHRPTGLPSVDRRPVQPRLGWRSPPANRYPGSHPNRPEPGSCSRRLLRRSTARRCSRLAPGCAAGASGGAGVRRCSRWRSFANPMGAARARHLPWRSSERPLHPLQQVSGVALPSLEALQVAGPFYCGGNRRPAARPAGRKPC